MLEAERHELWQQRVSARLAVYGVVTTASPAAQPEDLQSELRVPDEFLQGLQRARDALPVEKCVVDDKEADRRLAHRLFTAMRRREGEQAKLFDAGSLAFYAPGALAKAERATVEIQELLQVVQQHNRTVGMAQRQLSRSWFVSSLYAHAVDIDATEGSDVDTPDMEPAASAE